MEEITPEQLLAQYEEGGVGHVVAQDPEGGNDESI